VIPIIFLNVSIFHSLLLHGWFIIVLKFGQNGQKMVKL
jgi:hypothetical protein